MQLYYGGYRWLMKIYHNDIKQFRYLKMKDTIDRLWYFGKAEMLLTLTNQPWSLCHWPDLGGARFHFQMIHRSLKNSYVAGSLHPWSSTLFMQRRRPETMLHRSSLILRSRRNLLCSNLKYSQFVHVPGKFLHPPAQEWPMPMLTDFPLRFASCFLLSDLDVRLPSKLRMWKSSKRLWRTRGMTSFKGRQKCCHLFHKCGEMIANTELICQCKSNFPGRIHEA